MKRKFYLMSRFGPQLAYRLGLGRLIGRGILLLTTIGRKSGLPRVTPLQYEFMDEAYFVGAVFGTKTDWVKNLVAQPTARVRVKDQVVPVTAEIITNPEAIVDFIEYRLKKHPRMIGLIMRLDGLPAIRRAATWWNIPDSWL